MWTILLTSVALGADCPPVEASADGATTLGVRDLTGPLVITGVDGAVVRAEGDVCKLNIRNKGGQLFVTGSTLGGAVTLTVPRSLEAVTVYHHEGEVRITDVPSRVATVSIEGTVVASGVPQLRTDGVTGGVTQEDQATAEL
jgi:hypothetical protein